MDGSRVIKMALYNVLNANANITAPVVDRVRSNTPFPYILIGSANSDEIDVSKTEAPRNYIFPISVATRSAGDTGNPNEMEDIVDEILTTLPRHSGFPVIENYNIYTMTHGSVEKDEVEKGSNTYWTANIEIIIRAQFIE